MIFIILDRHNRVRGFPYVAREMAVEHAKECDATWPKAGPHRIVPFGPIVALVATETP